VFLSIGTWKESWVYLTGTELAGVMPALLFLEGVAKQQPVAIGRKVTVIGGGNAAIDSAARRCAWARTSRFSTAAERKDMPAIPARNRSRRGRRREDRLPGRAAPHQSATPRAG